MFIERKHNYISLYRERLISAGVVKPGGYGFLCFNYPYMREFLMYTKKERGVLFH